jgi:hypothetical protein
MAAYEFVTEADNLSFTSADLANPIDFVTSTNNIVIAWPTLVFADKLANEVIVTTDTEVRLYTSADLPDLIDFTASTRAQIINFPLLQDPFDGITFAKITEESIIEGLITIYTTDFVSITSFNLPEAQPLAFPERWAG